MLTCKSQIEIYRCKVNFEKDEELRTEYAAALRYWEGNEHAYEIMMSKLEHLDYTIRYKVMNE